MQTITPDQEATYDAQAKDFAEKAPNLISWRYLGARIIDRQLRPYLSQQTRLFDQGSASGRLEEYFIGYGVRPENMLGVEISSKQVDIAKERIPNSTFIHGDIRDFKPMQDKDLCVSHMVYEFLDPQGLKDSLENAYNSLVDNGRFLMIVTHPDKVAAKYGLKEEGWFELDAPWGGTIQNWNRSKESYIKAIQEAGFTIECVEDAYLPLEAKSEDPETYERYSGYGPIRLAVSAIWPPQN